MDDISMTLLDKAPAFYQYGPFFIVLLLIVLAVIIGRSLQTATTRKDPPGHIRFMRATFAGVLVFTGLLIIGTCVWWVRTKDVESVKEYVVRIDISDVQPTDVLEPFSDDLFYRNRDPNDPARRKDTFVAVEEKPFKLHQLLEIVHKKGADASKGVRYSVPIDDGMLKDRFAAFKLTFNDLKGKYELVPVESVASNEGHSVIGRALAMQPTPIPGEAIQIPRQVRQMPLPSVRAAAPAPRIDEPAAVLLDESSSIAKQVEALDALLGAMDRGTPPNLFQRRGSGDETLLSYLITLSHHEDKLLSYKARTVLQRADYLGAVSKIAAGQSTQPQPVQWRILAALEPRDWTVVEQRMRTDGFLPPDRNTAPRSGLSPIPSATVDGTLYYGFTTWASLSGKQASCLAQVVYRQGDSQGVAPNDALGFVNSRKGFTFNFRTKSEALVFADAAAKCGASTQFVYKDDKRLTQFKE